ncbi:hypothetical protein AYM40_24905 [Paraburkholderia phytofirmans OLGA172]|uniref:Uncharacterized protein n=1 Tax=Paraburkholderia phytofirmans OLGA172 TaxID=1417228 RepID=A0A161HZG3_9BURK|nr:hypothetical protein AYM40_24905 [Paraburkholderia phytofirmans OLGA172]
MRDASGTNRRCIEATASGVEQVGDDPWQQFVDAVDWMLSDTSDDVAQIGFGIEAIQFGCTGQGVDCGAAFGGVVVDLEAAITYRRMTYTSGRSNALHWPTQSASVERLSSTPSRALSHTFTKRCRVGLHRQAVASRILRAEGRVVHWSAKQYHRQHEATQSAYAPGVWRTGIARRHASTGI